MQIQELSRELSEKLVGSTDALRKRWAAEIVEGEIDIRELTHFLFEDKRMALRFQWLLSDVGLYRSQYLLGYLPYLWNLCSDIVLIDFRIAFATYWSISGIPEEQEGIALALLMTWISDSDVNITIKTRALKALIQLTKKYPELKPEVIEQLQELSVNTNDSLNPKLNGAIKLLSSPK